MEYNNGNDNFGNFDNSDVCQKLPQKPLFISDTSCARGVQKGMRVAIRLGNVCVWVCLLVNCNHYTVIRSFQQTTQALELSSVRRRNEILKFPSIS